jgi:hypothetical protein
MCYNLTTVKKERGNKMERVEILSKETLLCYLINELSNENFEVTTHLDREGCWLGEITIKAVNEPINEDQEYFYELAKIMLDK